MTTAAQYLGQFGISLDVARTFIVSHVPDKGAELLSALQAFDISEEWLAEIFGVDIATTRELAMEYLSIDTSVLPDSHPDATVSSVTSATVTEGGTLQHNVTLSGETLIETSLSAAFNAPDSSMTPLSLGDLSSIAFSNGVTFDGTALVVPRGVSSFTISFGTQDDTAVEGTEGYSLVVGGQGTAGAVFDNDSHPPPSGQPLMPDDLADFAAHMELNTDTSGPLTTAALRAVVIAHTNEADYWSLFDASGYLGADDGTFTSAETGWSASIGEQDATAETIESVFYGTVVNALRSVDFGEEYDLASYVYMNEQALHNGDEQAYNGLVDLIAEAIGDPAGGQRAFDDAEIAQEVIDATIMLVGYVQYDPSLFHSLVSWIND